MTTLLNNTVTLASNQLSQVIEQLKDLADWQLINIYTDYADENRYEDIHDLSQDTINDLFESAWDAVTKSNHDGFNENDSYFVFNGYGLMSSFTSLDSENSPIDVEELAQWVVDNDLFNDYNIEVTTLDDMYNAILDNLEDASSLDDIINVAEYLGLTVEEFDSNNESPADYESNIINDITNHIHSDFELLSKAAEFMKLDV